MVGTLVRRCRCATSWDDLDFAFDLAVVTLTYKILSGVYLGNRKVQEVDTGYGHWLRCVDVKHHGVTLICPLTLPYNALSGLYFGNNKV